MHAMANNSNEYARRLGITRAEGRLHYIGRVINLGSLRNFILDKRLNETHTIQLHTDDLDALFLEYRDTYGDSMSVPIYWMSVRLVRDSSGATPKNRVLLQE